MGIKFVLSLLFALIIAVFAIQNSAAVNINFITWHISISQALVILISAIFGAVIVMILGIVKHFKLNSIIKSEKKAITDLENKNQNLKKQLDDCNTKQNPETFASENQNSEINI